MNQSIVLHQLGQCLLAQRQYPQAFRHFADGNDLLRFRHPHGQPVQDGSYGLETIARLRGWLEQNPPATWSQHPVEPGTKPPVFMVGFPRSGTTLMDQALSAHPEIEVLEEYEFLDGVRRDWVDGEGLNHLAGMSTRQLRAARQQYLTALEARRIEPSKPCVIDKLPLNLVYLFLVHRLFPDARILFMLRDPRDACLSCFFQSFDLQGAMPYFLDLEQTAVYYDAVMALARQSLEQVSNPVMQQRYEHLVKDFESSVRNVLRFLDLPWSPDVLQYRQKSSRKVIDTPSYQQVTQPIYHDAVGRWQHFSPQLEPLRRWLDPWVAHFGY